jgi:transcriptional regulator with XRE-family HTH domain
MEKNFNRIKEWLLPKLQEANLSVEQFAHKIGLSRAAIYFYLTDVSRPTEQTMAKMCHALGVPFEEGLAQYTPKLRGRAKRAAERYAKRANKPKLSDYNSHLYG